MALLIAISQIHNHLAVTIHYYCFHYRLLNDSAVEGLGHKHESH